MKREVKIGIIGTGKRGRSLGSSAKKLDSVEITALFDINPVRVNEAKKDLEVDESNCFTDNYNQMLENEHLDAVIVSTPDYAHTEPAVSALKADKHVYCEKVMATTVEDSTEIAEAASSSSKIFYAGHNARFGSTKRKLNELIKNGELGEIKMVWARRFVEGSKYWHRWHRYKKNSGGLLAHKGVHYIDQMNWNSLSRPNKVAAFGGLDVYKPREDAPARCSECEEREECPHTYYIEKDFPHRYYKKAEKEDGYIWDTCIYAPGSDVFDNATVMISYENGVRGTYMECHFAPIMDRDSEVGAVGDRGLAVADTKGLTLRKTHTKEEISYKFPSRTGSHGGSDFLAVKEFVECIRKEREPESNAEAGWDSAAAGITAQISAEKGGKVYLLDGENHTVKPQD